MEKLNLIKLEDFLDSLDEEKLNKTFTRGYLDSSYKKYKKSFQLNDKKSFQIYTPMHVYEQFEKRFVVGDEFVGKYGTIGAKVKFNQLPNWKKLQKSDLDRVLVDGINKIISDYKMAIGAYFVISESTRLVIPVIVGYIQDSPNYAIVINTILHTGMSNIDTFHLGRQEYDHEKIKVERTLDDFYNVLLEYYDGSLGILTEDNLIDREGGVQLEYTVMSHYNVDTNYPIVIVK